MRHQILPGNRDSAEIRGLEGGVSYSVRVTALVGDREGAPVSIVVATRRRMFGVEGVLERGLCSRAEAYGEGFVLGLEKDQGFIVSLCGEMYSGRGLVQPRGRASLIVMLSLKRLRPRHLWRLFK